METTGFRTARRGTDAAQAFAEAVEEARRERRAGSIASKTGFVVIGDENAPVTFAAAHRMATDLLVARDPRVWDVRGPAGAIPVKAIRDARVRVPIPPGVYGTDADAIRAAIDGYHRDEPWKVVNRPRMLRGDHVRRTYLAAAEWDNPCGHRDWCSNVLVEAGVHLPEHLREAAI